MTTEVDAAKSSEFLRRRKLRLQQVHKVKKQVREQSKDIAKKIRQRAKVEKFRQITDIDAKKEREYIENQEKLVKRLEQLYVKSLQNVGTGHKDAFEVTQQDIVKKADPSKLRGREAVAELRKKRQEKLDEQKKILDRKLQAREVANELSREKSAAVTKNLTKQSSKPEDPNKTLTDLDEVNKEDNNKNLEKTDMGTQWESGELLTEWEPNIPSLSLPKDSGKDSVNEINKSEKSKRLNLFALSDEMPSSLRGGLTNITEPVQPSTSKPSLTLVSEYLQNRNLRLREPEPSKRPTDDLQSIKHTILRTRASRADGSVFDDVCHVLDGQVIPAPTWQAEISNLSYNTINNKNANLSYKYSSLPLNRLSLFSKPIQRPRLNNFMNDLCSARKNKCHYKNHVAVAGKEKSSQPTESEISLGRAKSVSVYNHNTRDIVNVPCDKEKIVSRDNKIDDDAYAQAMKETNSVQNMAKDKLNKRQEDMRNKIAVTRQNVDKEYRDTLAFLNALPKDKGTKPIRTAYMDDHQQQLLKERHQQKLQNEFTKIEKECYKHNCKHSKRKATVLEKSNNMSKSKSPVTNKHTRDFEYSWMPVPESDGSLAIHTIPNTRKTGNSVKFSETDSYHEYRSRHKHTPPTKDSIDDRPKRVETVVVQSDSEIESSTASETSSVENLNLGRDTNRDSKLKDAERIIIYKILDSRKNKKRRHKKSEGDNVGRKSLTEKDVSGNKNANTRMSSNLEKDTCAENNVSIENLEEGVYKAVSSDGFPYNVTSYFCSNLESWQTSVQHKPWWDNITSKYFPEELIGHKNQRDTHQNKQNYAEQNCNCRKDTKTTHDNGAEKEEKKIKSKLTKPSGCNVDHIENENFVIHPEVTSSTSFKTAANEKTNIASPDNRFMKFIDEGGQDTGKFYIGASGFIKDDNYEVVIQLRKKEAEKRANIEVKGVSSSETLKSNADTASNIAEDIQAVAPKNIQEHIEGNQKSQPIIVEDKCTASQNNAQTETDSHVRQSEEEYASKNMCEKAVHTSFQDTFSIPIQETKTNPVPRPAMSTYTQTSFNSSTQRPIFMHMSSSTSTAYMSPPELVLPKFLRHNYVTTRQEMYESENTVNQLESHYETIDLNECKKYETAKCKHHMCPRKVLASKSKSRNNLLTSPNTGRSFNEEETLSEPGEIKKGKCICHKCKGRSDTKICSKSHRKRSTSTLYMKSSRDLHRINVKSSSKQKCSKATFKTKLGDPNINPIVKNYVHKLLDLNKEGLKAIEVINQDCSVATTPRSSIIEIPSNKQNKETVENKISLEQIKNVLKRQVLKENFEHIKEMAKKDTLKNNECQTENNTGITLKVPKKKSLHKVKSLNISKQLLRRKKQDAHRVVRQKKLMTSTSSLTKEGKHIDNNEERKACSRSKSSPTSRHCESSEYKNSTSSDIMEKSTNNRGKSSGKKVHVRANEKNYASTSNLKQPASLFDLPGQTITSMSSDSEVPRALLKRLNTQRIPTNISTQTNSIIDAEIKYMKLAENKLQNMEKIADLTDKCTKRLSNLAKVLEEVRRNKSLAYSQITSTDSPSESDNKSEKNAASETSTCDSNVLEQNKEVLKSTTLLTIPPNLDEKTLHLKESIEFTPFLKDIPKPDTFKTPTKNTILSSNENIIHKSDINTDHAIVKARGRPPPALTRLNLRNGHEPFITPHELSTVIEVDSPMSLKLKSSRHESKFEGQNKSNRPSDEIDSQQDMAANKISEIKEAQVNLDLLQASVQLPRTLSKSNDSSDDSKMRMMDMKQFNDIMLKPFISLQDYAKQCNIGLDEGSNLEDIVKDDAINDDLSSLHSDGSLPDVIAELLKRNIISEPFKFDTGSNINSTTMSSESTISLIALSKARKDRKKASIVLKNKENIGEISETLSISSNPDLENAFQKMGMGWASSTLKKTKERLALSSSSNTSSSSMAQFKIKNFSQEVPAFPSDSTSSLAELTSKREKKNQSNQDSSKNAVQQTSLTNSMTVKEFLTNVLAKKITFNNKSKNESGEFVSLYETNMPDEMKHSVRNDGDQSSVASTNKRRTSTPVQIFRSTAYRSSSSSNTSNGLFSNADDLSSVKVTSTSIRNHSTSDKDELTIPNYSLKTRKAHQSAHYQNSKSD